MSEETREPRAQETLTVTVQARPGFPEPINPPSITLTDTIYKVVWQCDDLPAGATLLIRFREDPRGPFFLLEFAGNRVVGYGNRGPDNTLSHYTYDAAVLDGGVVTSLGVAEVQNATSWIIEIDLIVGPPHPSILFSLIGKEEER
jgi:hypothetical protein